MTGIFISYREDDAKAWAIALRDDLAALFGDAQLFLDKDSLHAGRWREQLEHHLRICKVFIVVIGSKWLTAQDAQGRQRLHLTDDVHRGEVALALARSDVTVIPVLVDEAKLPLAEQLPADLWALAVELPRFRGYFHRC